MKNHKGKNKDRFQILIVFLISILSLYFWESVVVTPIKLFVVLIHETSHAIMTYLTGGTVESINFSPNFGGVTKSKGGNLILIASAGYMGSLVLGAGIFISAEFEKFRNWFITFLAIILFLIAVNWIEGGYETFLTILTAAFLYFFPKYISPKIVKPVLKFIGLTSCLYIISDIKQDLLTTTLRETDTQIIEYITGIPALVIGFVWFLVSLIIVYFILRREF